MTYKVTINFGKGPAFGVELIAADVMQAAAAGRKLAIDCGYTGKVKKTVVVPA